MRKFISAVSLLTLCASQNCEISNDFGLSPVKGAKLVTFDFENLSKSEVSLTLVIESN